MSGVTNTGVQQWMALVRTLWDVHNGDGDARDEVTEQGLAGTVLGQPGENGHFAGDGGLEALSGAGEGVTQLSLHTFSEAWGRKNTSRSSFVCL